jgi:hypothetical protein
MNYLQLCQRVHQEAGLSGSGAASVKGQVGMDKKIVDWVQTAYQEIINLKPWDFTWKTVDVTVPVGTQLIDKVAFGLDDLGFLSRVLVSGKQLTYTDWKQGDATYLNQPQGAVAYFSVLPNGNIKLYPSPTTATTVTIEYHRSKHILLENSDVPLIPDNFHMVIVYKALSMYAANDEAVALFQDAIRQYDSWMGRMDMSQREQPQIGISPIDANYINASTHWGQPWVLW